MRSGYQYFAVACLAAWLAPGSQPASAQSRIQSILDTAPAQSFAPANAPVKFYKLAPPLSVAANGADKAIGPPDSIGPYVTVCVRTCDGYYFPIRQNALRRHFRADAERCQRSCTSETRLFYYPLRYGRPQTMANLDGKKYADQPNAFAFKTALKPGCTCKAAPWTEEAAARHRKYAELEAAAAHAPAKTAETNVAAAPAPVPPAPQPVQRFDFASATPPVTYSPPDLRSGLAATAEKPAPVPPTLAAVNTAPSRILDKRRNVEVRPPEPVNYRAKFKIKPASRPGFAVLAGPVILDVGTDLDVDAR